MKKKAIIVICPGGAYRWLFPPRESEPVARAFEAMGYEADIMNYTVKAEGESEPLGLKPVR